MCETPFGKRSGGQILAQAAVHVACPAGSTLNRYSVSPALVARTLPSFGTTTALMVTALLELLADAGTEEAKAPTARVTAAKAPALAKSAARVFPVIVTVFPVRTRAFRNPMS
jgi:hypothetical protein